MKALIVGAGCFGATAARVLTDAGVECLVIDRRNHVGGNAFTRYSESTHCHVHVYGPHIFHTSNPAVWAFVNRFAEFTPFRNHVKATPGDGRLYSFPINLMTLHQVFGVTTPEQARALLATEVVPCADPQNLEQHCLASVGPRLYQMFIEGYTTKQWGRSPKELPASIIKRLPVRMTFDDCYYSDIWQGVPTHGYTAMFHKMLEGIPVALGVDFRVEAERFAAHYDVIVYTGGLDELCGDTFGPLEYRSLTFVERWHNGDAQGNAVINNTDKSVPHTRSVEYRHMTGSRARRSIVVTETPCAEGDPFYPVPTEANMRKHDLYKVEARRRYPMMHFGGRLAEYRYLDMHQAIASALAKSEGLGRLLR